MQQAINNEKLFHQKVRFWRLAEKVKTTITDTDFVIEKNDQVFIFGEIKRRGKLVDWSQEITYIRIVDRLFKTGAYAFFIEVDHDAQDDDDIVLEECTIRKVYFNGKWTTSLAGKNVREVIEAILEKYQ